MCRLYLAYLHDLLFTLPTLPVPCLPTLPVVYITYITCTLLTYMTCCLHYLHYLYLTYLHDLLFLCHQDLHLATSEVWRSVSVLPYCVVYYYNGAQWYEQFLQVSQLYQALILLGLALSSEHLCIFGLHSAVYIHVYIYIYYLKFFVTFCLN